MDPITHGLLGGVAAQAVHRRPLSPFVAGAGIIGGMLPDLDVLIRAREQPLWSIEFHRHFTHSLAFIPIGGLIAALFVWFITKKRHPFWKVYLPATVGYGTHCLLDACTTYGTVLFWPFSRSRVSWDIMSIIDPIFTFILLVGLLLALLRARPLAARLCLILVLAYIGLGHFQHQRILDYQARIAAERGHGISRSRAYPSFGNLLVWRSFYENGNRIYIDALRRTPDGREKIYPGASLPAFDVSQVSPAPPPDSTLARDLKTYLWFSENWLGTISSQPWVLGDVRFAGLPNNPRPIWGIAFFPEQPKRHVQKLRFPALRRENFEVLWKMIRGQDIQTNVSLDGAAFQGQPSDW